LHKHHVGYTTLMPSQSATLLMPARAIDSCATADLVLPDVALDYWPGDTHLSGPHLPNFPDPTENVCTSTAMAFFFMQPGENLFLVFYLPALLG
jgi:hypothetical protein